MTPKQEIGTSRQHLYYPTIDGFYCKCHNIVLGNCENYRADNKEIMDEHHRKMASGEYDKPKVEISQEVAWELLEACKKALTALTTPSECLDPNELYDVLKQSIAKAEGK